MLSHAGARVTNNPINWGNDPNGAPMHPGAMGGDDFPPANGYPATQNESQAQVAMHTAVQKNKQQMQQQQMQQLQQQQLAMHSQQMAQGLHTGQHQRGGSGASDAMYHQSNSFPQFTPNQMKQNMYQAKMAANALEQQQMASGYSSSQYVCCCAAALLRCCAVVVCANSN